MATTSTLSIDATEKTPFVKKRGKVSSKPSPVHSDLRRDKQRPPSNVEKDDGKHLTVVNRIFKPIPRCFARYKYGVLFYFFGIVSVFLPAKVSQLKVQDECHLDPMKLLRKDSSIEDISNGAVASDHQVCSKIGVSILRDGGNAIDAAVASILCLGVANPASSGLGGGAFVLIQADKQHFENRTREMKMPPFHDERDVPPLESRGKILEVIDCRETAPTASTADMFAGEPTSASSFGGLAIAIPGELRGLELAHARHVSS